MSELHHVEIKSVDGTVFGTTVHIDGHLLFVSRAEFIADPAAADVVMLRLHIPATRIDVNADESAIIVTYEDPITGETFTRETAATR